MRVAFFSNFLTHHQEPFCKEMLKLTNGNFRFIACEPFNASRVSSGYSDLNANDYVIRAYESDEQYKEAEKWCIESDAIIHGTAWEKFIKIRKKQNLPIFRYSERIYKTGINPLKLPLITVKRFLKNGFRKNEYMLCASAYTAFDYSKTYEFLGRCYKWGYFPEFKSYDETVLLNAKEELSILWVGRLIDWKHPEVVVEIAKRLRNNGYEFKLNIIGDGQMKGQLADIIKAEALEENVHLLGSVPSQDVRSYMEKAKVFLFTSDRQEGWGAVLNEAMNSGCAVVCNNQIGAVPYLIKDGINGLIYKNGDIDELYRKVEFLMQNPCEIDLMGKQAYNTIKNHWNPQNAAERFVELAQAIINKDVNSTLFEDGICSKAEILKDG